MKSICATLLLSAVKIAFSCSCLNLLAVLAEPPGLRRWQPTGLQVPAYRLADFMLGNGLLID